VRIYCARNRPAPNSSETAAECRVRSVFLKKTSSPLVPHRSGPCYWPPTLIDAVGPVLSAVRAEGYRLIPGSSSALEPG
jgi:hypothetical protein